MPITINYKRLREFYEFMKERHGIFNRRFVKLKPAPWTDDPILRDCKFTNIFRELDRGTIYWYENVHMDTNLKELLFRTIAYRLVNRVETFQALHGWVPRVIDDIPLFIRNLEDYGKNNAVFTSAHLVAFTPMKRLPGLGHALKQAKKLLPDMVSKIKKSKGDAHETFKAVTQVHGVGGFIGYEIVCDLAYAGRVKNINSWCNVGPGAKPALDLIFPKKEKSHLKRCLYLYKNQKRHLKKLGIKFPIPKWCKGELSLRTFEHSCCEWRKYVHASEGKGRNRTLFRGLSNNKKGEVDTKGWYYKGLKKWGFIE